MIPTYSWSVSVNQKLALVDSRIIIDIVGINEIPKAIVIARKTFVIREFEESRFEARRLASSLSMSLCFRVVSCFRASVVLVSKVISDVETPCSTSKFDRLVVELTPISSAFLVCTCFLNFAVLKITLQIRKYRTDIKISSTETIENRDMLKPRAYSGMPALTLLHRRPIIDPSSDIFGADP